MLLPRPMISPVTKWPTVGPVCLTEHALGSHLTRQHRWGHCGLFVLAFISPFSTPLTGPLPLRVDLAAGSFKSGRILCFRILVFGSQRVLDTGHLRHFM